LRLFGLLVSFKTILSVMRSVLKASLSNPGNDRPLPQMLWDAIERFG
jgi:hypothetical protein